MLLPRLPILFTDDAFSLEDPGSAMNTFEKRSIGIEAAQRIVEAAFREADSLGIKVAVTVVDESGLLKAFGRQDGAALINTQSSQSKAKTAVSLGMPSRAWYPMIKDDPALLHGV